MSQLGLTMTDGHNGNSALPRKRRRKKSGAVIALSFGIVLLLVLGALFFGYKTLMGTTAADYEGDGHGQVTIEIKSGQSVAAMGQTMAQNDVVQSADAFVKAASRDSRATNIQPGFYDMHLQMSGAAALDRLFSPDAKAAQAISIPEGSRTAAIFDTVSKATGIPLADFAAVAKDPSGVGLPSYANNHLEGYLFPSTYTFAPNSTAKDVVKQMVAKFKEVAKEIKLESKAAAMGRTPHDIVIIASLLQAEGLPDSYAKIARVVYNRLDCKFVYCLRDGGLRGKLAFDSTLNYAQGTHDANLSATQLAQNGPYNTHLNVGLPPTPIDNPGEEAITAALNPAVGDWLFFVSNPQTTIFSETYEQQQQAEEKAKTN